MRTINIIIIQVILIPGSGFSQNDFDNNECTWDNFNKITLTELKKLSTSSMDAL
jgi:hypothetical protein